MRAAQTLRDRIQGGCGQFGLGLDLFFEQAQGQFGKHLHRILQRISQRPNQFRLVSFLQKMPFHDLERQLAGRWRGGVEHDEEVTGMRPDFSVGRRQTAEQIDPAFGDMGTQRALQLAQNQRQKIGARQLAFGDPADQRIDHSRVQQRLEKTFLRGRLVVQPGQDHGGVEAFQRVAEKTVATHRHAEPRRQRVPPFGMLLARFQHQSRHALIAAGEPRPAQHPLEHPRHGFADPRFRPIQQHPSQIQDEFLRPHRLPGTGFERARHAAFPRQPRQQQIQAAVERHQGAISALLKQAALQGSRIVERARRGQRGRPIAQKGNRIFPDGSIQVGKLGRPRFLLEAAGPVQHLEQFAKLLEQHLALLGGQRSQHVAQPVAVALEQFAQQDLKQLVAHDACSAAKRRASKCLQGPRRSSCRSIQGQVQRPSRKYPCASTRNATW